LHLLEHDFGLAFDRQALDLAGGRIAGRDVRHKDEIAAPDGHAARDFAGFGIGGQRLDANGLSVHGHSSYLVRPCVPHAPRCSQQSRRLSFAIGSARAEPSLLADGAAGAVKSPMVAAANLVEVAALVGDTARATILAALMGGQALTGSDLAYLARVSRPTASEHLLKLVEARLVAVTKQGRYRYYRIASPLVARMLESIIAVAAIEVPSRYQPRSIRDDALRFARTCYDHLAGQVGVAITDALVANGHIVLTEDGGEVTDAGTRFLARALALAVASVGTSALAQDYPTRPVTIVVGYTPGATSDLLARTVAERLNAAWGQSVIVDNRSGVGGNIAAAYVARAPADGYTLMVGTDAIMTSNVFLYKNTPFDPVKDFAPITNAG